MEMDIPALEMMYYLRSYGISMAEDEIWDMIQDSEPEEGLNGCVLI